MMKRILKGRWFLLVVALYLCACEDSPENKTIEAQITQFSVWDQKTVNHPLHVDNVENIISNRQEIPAYVNLSRLIAEFKLSHQDAVLKVNDRVQRSGQGEMDFTKEIVYDLYVGNEKQRSYKVNITKGTLSNTFRTFTFPGSHMEPYQPTINEETGEITNEREIPLNIDITALKPEFTTSERGAVVKVNGVVQTSGVASHDFSKPVVYTIEGEDGTSREFTVNLKQGNEYYLENPIMSGSYADPTVIRMGNEFYVYVTGGRVRGYRSTDLLNWNRIGSVSEVFTQRPDFTDDNVSETGMWAPDINYFDGKYVMYYSISKWGGGATCGIGVGISDLPQGPFLPPPGNPNGKLFVSGEIGVHNSIDPCFFEEDGKRYLFWGSWGGIHMTELTADGYAVKDMTKKKQVAGKSFEAVYIHKRGNYYYMFASIGACCEGMNSSYKVVVGRSTRLDGPYLDKNGVDMNSFDAWNPTHYNPIVLRGNEMFAGPGHNSRIITDDKGVDWMLYHAYVHNGSDSRSLMIDKVEWDADGWPMVGNGTPSFALEELPFFN
jgi:arabinan endo-1,5-alpha-L-arabinosidase